MHKAGGVDLVDDLVDDLGLVALVDGAPLDLVRTGDDGDGMLSKEWVEILFLGCFEDCDILDVGGFLKYLDVRLLRRWYDG